MQGALPPATIAGEDGRAKERTGEKGRGREGKRGAARGLARTGVWSRIFAVRGLTRTDFRVFTVFVCSL